MEEHEFLSVNNAKTMLMTWEGGDFILYSVLMDDFDGFTHSKLG